MKIINKADYHIEREIENCLECVESSGDTLEEN